MPRGKTKFAPWSAGPLELGPDVADGDPEPLERANGGAARLRQGSEQDVLGVELWIAALDRLAQRLLEHGTGERGQGRHAIHGTRRRRRSDRITKARERGACGGQRVRRTPADAREPDEDVLAADGPDSQLDRLLARTAHRLARGGADHDARLGVAVAPHALTVLL